MRKTPASLSVRVRTAVAVPALLALLLIFPGAACAFSGTVKWYDEAKGFGFIQPDEGGADVFVSAAAIKRAGLRSLREGQKVEFQLERDRASGKMAAGQLFAIDGQPGSSQSPAPAAEPATTPAAPAEEAANDTMASDEDVADEDTAAEEEEESDDTGAADEDSAAGEESDDQEEVSDEGVSDEEGEGSE